MKSTVVKSSLPVIVRFSTLSELIFKLVKEVLSTTLIVPSNLAPVAEPAINALSIVTVSKSKFWITWTAVAFAPVRVTVARSEFPFPGSAAPISIAPSTSAEIVTVSKLPFPWKLTAPTLPERVTVVILLLSSNLIAGPDLSVAVSGSKAPVTVRVSRSSAESISKVTALSEV